MIGKSVSKENGDLKTSAKYRLNDDSMAFSATVASWEKTYSSAGHRVYACELIAVTEEALSKQLCVGQIVRFRIW